MRRSVGLMCLFLSFPVSVSAQDTDNGEGFFDQIEVAVDIGLTHDRRDRGIAQSDFEPSPDFRLSLTSGGAFAGFSAASIEDFRGSEAQLRAYAGYGISVSGFMLDASINMDSVHGETFSRFYPEIETSISRDFGLAYFRSGLQWAMEGRWSAPDNDSVYGFFDVELPVPTMPDITVIGHVGYDVRSDLEDVFDWSIGASYFLGELEVTLSYVDSHFKDQVPFNPGLDLGRGRFVVGTRYFF